MIKFIGFTIIFLIYFIIDGILKERRTKKQYSLPKEIKENYQQLKVVPDKIEILSKTYSEEVEVGQSVSYKAADALYDNNRNFTSETKYASTLVYYYSYMGKSIRLNSETIDMDPDSLKSLVRSQQAILIYYDKTNISNYYFDLSFLAS